MRALRSRRCQPNRLPGRASVPHQRAPPRSPPVPHDLRQRWTAGELADFACYFALFVNDDHGRATEPVSSGDFNTSGKNKECRRLGGSDVEQYFSRRVSAGWSARESKRSFALNCRQDREELIAAPINDAHENSWVVASRSQPPLL